MTQCQAILEYLQAHHEGITQLESFNALGVCRLSERIRELERQGYVFEHVPVMVSARGGRTARVVCYVIVQKEDERTCEPRSEEYWGYHRTAGGPFCG